jgi:CelD/BcsL family acetyltransferase involved in cellulose biosynthesis
MTSMATSILPSTLSIWEDLARRDAACTFFQTPAWHAAVAPLLGGESAPLLFEFGNIRAVLPLVKVRRPLRDVYISPFGTYSGLVCPDRLDAAQTQSVRDRLAGLNVELFSSPFAENPVAVGRSAENATYVIDLAKVNPADVPAGWAGNQRRHRRSADKAGLAVGLASDARDVDAYYAVYEKTLARWGEKARGRYPRELFQSLWRSLAPSGAMRLWLARREDRIVGGDVCFYHNRHAVQWHGVVDAEFFKAGAAQALLDAVVADAARRGFALYDMNPSGGLAAVEAFKKDFGSRRVEFRTWRNLTFPWSWAGRIRRLFASGE